MLFFQDVEAKLTLTRVATAPVLVAEIAKLTGSKLEVSPTLSTEVLMVSVENAKVSDVLARLAIAATAAWQPMEGGYRLVADNAARGIEGSSERARRLQAINEDLRKKQEAKAKAAKDQGEDMKVMMMGAFGGGDGVADFVPMLDLPAIAAMEGGDRIVFATNPNSAQRPLRGNVLAVISNLIAQHNKTAKTMSAGMDEMPEGLGALMQGPIGERMKRMSRPIVAAPTKIVVVASRGGNAMFGGTGLDVRLEARAYGANGEVLIEQTGSLGTSMMEIFASMAAKKPATAPETNTTPIAYSEDAKAFLAMKGGDGPMSFGAGMGSPKLTPSLRERFFAPDKFEPLGLVPGEGLAALAKARRKPLVACIPDDAYPGALNGEAPKTVEDIEQGFKTGSMRLVPDTTFLVVRAAEPDTARRTRVDRIALSNLMRAIGDHEAPTLDELANFASRTPDPARNHVSMSFIATFAPTTLGSMAGYVSWSALRLYAALTPAQRDTLAGGGKVPFGNLVPGAKTALQTMLYGAGDLLTVERPGVSNELDIFSMGMRMAMGGGGIDARDEPTEVAPRGLSNDGYLQASVVSDTIIRPTTQDGPVYYSIGMDELAMFKMISSSGIAAAAGDAMKLPESGRLGTRTTWSLRGYVAPGAYVASTLTDDRTPKDGRAVSIGNLPADLQAKVAQKAEKLKKSPLGAIMSMGAAFGKPPVQP